MTEQQIRVELENYMFNHGADSLAFGSIIATGANGANPHAQPGETVVKRGDMIVMDYGAGYHDYKSDMTRTVCVGEPTDEQRRVYDVVRQAHEACAAAGKARLHRLATSRTWPSRSSPTPATATSSSTAWGMAWGIEIHENPNFGRRWNRPVPEGSVVTVEPGIYLPGNFGVRLEDFGLMTAEGFVPFTQSTHELVCIDC